jgi:hypothetical protein
MPGHLANLPQFRPYGVSRAGLRAASGSFPFKFDGMWDEPFDGVGHVRQPRTPAHFAIRENIDTRLLLPDEGIANRAVFLRTQTLFGYLACGMRRADVEQFGWTQQTAYLLGSIA